MTDDLTLPGSIPGLLRRGSPVTHIDGSRLVVVELDGDDAKLPSGWAFTRLLTLDLTDATGRAHAAWWLATYFLAADGPPEPGRYMQLTSALWSFDGGAWVLVLLAAPDVHMHGHRLTPVGATETFAFPVHGRERSEYGVPLPWHWSAVPALAALDPNDPRLLPDGSRHVDAEALRLVVLHTAGLEVTR